MKTNVSPIDQQTFRRVMGHFPTGVVAVTASDGIERAAMTLQSFQSLSLDPQLVLISVAKTSTSWPTIRRIGSFAVTVLADHQSEIARGFSRRGADKFEGIDTVETPVFGHPAPREAVATMECRIQEIHEGGDHDIVVAELVTLDLGEHHERPLVFFASAFAGVEPAAGAITATATVQPGESVEAALRRRHLAPDAELAAVDNPTTAARISREPVFQLGGQAHGVWQMTPGVLSDVHGPESVCIISGRATVTISPGNETVELAPGDVFVIDAGETAEWTVHETIRKFYVVNRPS